MPISGNFNDSVKVKIQLSTRQLPSLIIKPSRSSFNNTGGLCGMWDGNENRELFVFDKNGIERFLPNNATDTVTSARDFWK